MTEKTKRINTADYRLDIDENVKKTFELRKFSKGGFTATINGEEVFVSWLGLILNAVLEGLPAVEITEGEHKGQKLISVPDAETFLRVFGRLQAHRAANPQTERGERGERTERPIDTRRQISNRIAELFELLKRKQATAEDNGWGVDYSEFIDELKVIDEEADALSVADTADQAAIKALQARLDALQFGKLKQFDDGPVLQDRIKAAEHGIEQLVGSTSAAAISTIRAALDEVIANAEAGNTRAAHEGLYGKRDREGKEVKDGVFAKISRLRVKVGAKTAEPEHRRGGRGQGSDRLFHEKGSPQGEAARSRAAARFDNQRGSHR